MNWTGGRLQRHSKANANAVLKAQRQHFTKARLRLQNGQKQQRPSQRSLCKPDNARRESSFDRQDDPVSHGARSSRIESQIDDIMNQRQSKATHFATSEAIPQNANTRKRQRSASSCERLRRPDSDILAESQGHPQSLKPHKADNGIRSSRKCANAKPEILKDTKSRLLKSSDWMGLSAVRPPKIGFPPAQEIQNIGKRRKITDEDRARQRGLYARYEPQPSLDDQLQNHRNIWRSPPAGSRDFSIRIGRNVNQSQSGRSESQQNKNMSTRKIWSEMTQPKTDTSHTPFNSRTPNDDEEILSKPSPRSHTPREPLIPLDEALDAENFDQVKSLSTSSSPLKQTSVHTIAIPNRHEPLLNNSYYDRNRHSREVASHYPSSPPFVIPRKLGSNFLGEREHDRLGSARSTEENTMEIGSMVPNLSDKGKILTDSVTKSSKLDSLSKSVSTAAREPNAASVNDTLPRLPHLATQRTFTLERQVEMEKKSGIDERTTPSLSDMQVSQTIFNQCLSPTDERPSLPLKIGDESIQANTWIFEHVRMPRRSQGKVQGQSPRQAISPKDVSEPTSTSRSCFSGRRGVTASSSAGRFPLHESSKQVPALDLFSKQAKAALSPTAETLKRRQIGPLRNAQKSSRSSNHYDQRENEKWIKLILGHNFQEVGKRLKGQNAGIAKPPQGLQAHSRGRHRSTIQADSQLSELDWTSSLRRNIASPKTIHTSANTVLNRPTQGLGQNRAEPTETDFLSRLSPMTGYLDERIDGISMHTNPARSKRSFIAAPSQDTRRRGAAPCVASQYITDEERSEKSGSTWLIERLPPERSQNLP